MNVIYDGYSFDRILMNLTISEGLMTKNGQEFLEKAEGLMTSKGKCSLLYRFTTNLLKRDVDLYDFKITEFTNSRWLSARELQFENDKLFKMDLQPIMNYLINDLKKDSYSLDDQKYLTALLYKNSAFSYNTNEFYNKEKFITEMEKAFEIYSEISKEYLQEDFEMGQPGNIRTFRRSSVFMYPTNMSLMDSNPFNTWSVGRSKNKGLFFNYVKEKIGIEKAFFSNEKDIEMFSKYLLSYFQNVTYDVPEEEFIETSYFESKIDNSTLDKTIDRDALLAFLSSYFDKRGDNAKAKKYADLCDPSKLFANGKIKGNNENDVYYNLGKKLITYYLLKNEINRAQNILDKFPDAFQKRNAMLLAIDSLQKADNIIVAFAITDSLLNSYIYKKPKYGNKLFEILGRSSTSSCDKIASLLMKDKNDNVKVACLKLLIRGKVFSGNYYNATALIPDYLSSASQLALYTEVLEGDLGIKQKYRGTWFKFQTTPWADMEYEDGEGGGDIVLMGE